LSPLVDLAATKELAREAVEMCDFILAEPCDLCIKDVDLAGQKLIIGMAKGAKDRVVGLPRFLGSATRWRTTRSVASSPGPETT
jgi:hypothetical protein